MAKTGYRFNPETLSYDRIHVSVKKKLWSLVVKFFSSLSLALVIFFDCFRYRRFSERKGAEKRKRRNTGSISYSEQRIGAYGRGIEKSGNPG